MKKHSLVGLENRIVFVLLNAEVGMKKVCSVILCLVVTALMVSGCGSSVSETKPVAEVKEEAKAMDTSQLQSMVAKYQKAIEAKKPQITKLQNKLKQIPISQLMGEDAKAIKADISQITASIRSLNERMRIYAAELNGKQ